MTDNIFERLFELFNQTRHPDLCRLDRSNHGVKVIHQLAGFIIEDEAEIASG